MSAQQRKLQGLKLQQASSFRKSVQQLAPINFSKPLKTLPDIPTSPRILSNGQTGKFQQIMNSYRSPNRNVIITAKRTSIQRQSISQQFKNLVKYTSSIQLDGLDCVKNVLKNGDSIISNLNRAQNVDYLLSCLADGHGPLQKELSQMITRQAVEYIQDLFNNTPIIGLSLSIHESFKRMYATIDQTINEQQSLDLKHSGSSLLTLITIGSMIYCANLGDQKAAYFYKKDIDPSGPKEIRKFAQKNLNIVHDTNNSREVQRISNKGGKIDQSVFKGQKSGSLKIWAQKQNYPGVKITRCFGNMMGKTVGIISEPEIIEFKVPKSGYLLIGSTGMWEKLDILVIDQILDTHFPPTCQEDVNEALKLIGDETKKYWDNQGEGSIDISIILVYIQQ